MADYGTFIQHVGDTLGAADFGDYVRRALGDKAGDYYHIGLEDHYRRAIDAALEGSGIFFQGERFYGPDAALTTSSISAAIVGALHKVDFWEIASHHSRHEERKRDEALKGMAEVLAADFHFDHVDHGWDPDRRREELTMVVAGNKHEPQMTYIVSVYWGDQPPRPDKTVPAKSDPDCLAYEVEALWEEEGDGEQVQRAALCASPVEVLALMRGLRAEFAVMQGNPLGVPEQPAAEPDPMVAVANEGRAAAAGLLAAAETVLTIRHGQLTRRALAVFDKALALSQVDADREYHALLAAGKTGTELAAVGQDVRGLAEARRQITIYLEGH